MAYAVPFVGGRQRFAGYFLLFRLNHSHIAQHRPKLPVYSSTMQFLILLWLSKYPALMSSEQGSQLVAAAAFTLTQDTNTVLPAYERSLLNRVARHEMTLGHLLAYLREQDQA